MRHRLDPQPQTSRVTHSAPSSVSSPKDEPKPSTCHYPSKLSINNNNIAGPIVADPVSHNVYQIFASGEVGILKAKTADSNNAFVSRSTDAGMHWTPVLVFAGPLLSTNVNLFPEVAVNPTNDNVYATWSNASTAGTNVYFSFSSDGDASWSSPVIVNTTPANAAVFPWIAAQAGTVDVVYYGTTGVNAAGAVWHVYLAQDN